MRKSRKKSQALRYPEGSLRSPRLGRDPSGYVRMTVAGEADADRTNSRSVCMREAGSVIHRRLLARPAAAEQAERAEAQQRQRAGLGDGADLDVEPAAG